VKCPGANRGHRLRNGPFADLRCLRPAAGGRWAATMSDMTKVCFGSPPNNFRTPSETQPPYKRRTTSCACVPGPSATMLSINPATIQCTRRVTLPFNASLDDTLVWADPSSLSGYLLMNTHRYVTSITHTGVAHRV